MISLCSNIDWLQLNVRRLEKNAIIENNSYNIVDMPYSTQQFKQVQEVWKKGERIATLVSGPHSEIIDPGTIIIKLDNKTLYQRNLYEYCQTLLDDLNLTFHNFSRIDIALDFNHLRAGRSPEKMMKAILTDKILSRNKGKIAFHGTREHGVTLEYMRLGERTSGLVAYLYNKTKEMEAKELKPWIVESWKENELDLDKTVWRIEFSITDFNYKLVDRENADLLDIDKLAFLLIARRPETIQSLLKKYFSFVLNNGQKRKDRMKEIKIFGELPEARHLEKISQKTASNRSTKILIKQLHKLNDQLRENHKQYSLEASHLMNHIINKTELSDWYNNKKQYW